MDLTSILLATQNPATRKEAEEKLNQAEQQNTGAYFQALAVELATEGKAEVARQLAGLMLKNALWAKDKTKDNERRARWTALPADTKQAVKDSVIATLQSTSQICRNTACQVIAKLGGVELPLQQWPQLIEVLTKAVTAGDASAKAAALTAFNYLCEELAALASENGPEFIPEAVTNSILTGVVQGMREPTAEIKVAATKALYHALVLANKNFNNKTERDFIVQVVLENCSFPDEKVQVAALECVVQIATEYYDLLTPYMQAFGQLTWERMKGSETVAIPAMEFWSSICDEEVFLFQHKQECDETGEQPQRVSQNYILQALPFLLPILLETLTKQESEEAEDEWTLAMAAGTCLSLCAEVVKDEIVNPVLQFVNLNWNHPDWKHREAAILAYGSIMEGPSSDRLQPLLQQSFASLVQCLQTDKSVAVRDTAAWTIGRIAQHHHNLLTPMLGAAGQEGLIAVLLGKLKDEPRVASNVCWVFKELAEHHDAEDEIGGYRSTSPLSPFFPSIAEVLLEVAQRPDADEKQLRDAAYNSLSILIKSSAADCIQYMDRLTVALLERLERTFQFPNPRAQEISELQGVLCGCLQVLTHRLKEHVSPLSERLFNCYLRVFQHYQAVPGQNNSLPEEALLAVSALAYALNEQFERFMPHFAPLLLVGLSNFEEPAVCKISSDVVGDLCRALGTKIVPYCEPILTHLYNNLQNTRVDRKLKPGIVICFGDIAQAVGGDFEKYLAPVVQLLQEAANVRPEHGPADSEEWMDYIHRLRDSVLQAYTGITHGMRESNKLPVLKQYVNAMLDLVQRVADANDNDEVLKSAISLTGDLIMAYQLELTQHIAKGPFLEKLIKLGMAHSDPSISRSAKWLGDLLKKYRPK